MTILGVDLWAVWGVVEEIVLDLELQIQKIIKTD